MTRVWFLVPADELRPLVDRLSALGLVHPEPLPEPAPEQGSDPSTSGGLPPLASFLRPEPTDTAALDERLTKLRQVLEAFDTFAPVARGFAANFVSLPLEVSRQEYDRVLAETEVPALYGEVAARVERHAEAVRRRGEIEAVLETLRPWRGAPVGAPPAFAHCAAWLGVISARVWRKLEADEQARGVLTAWAAAESAGKVLVAAVALKEDAEAAGDLLRRAGLVPLEIPPGTAAIDDRIAALEEEAQALAAEAAALAGELADLAGKHRRPVTVCLAHWEVAQRSIGSLRGALRSERVAILSGYVRSADLVALRRALEEESLPVGLVARDPGPDEQVPVSVKTNRLFAPAQALTNLFGVPDYLGFDPSPFIFLTFFIFFGFCFGDAIYGLIILVAAWLIARRVRAYPGLHDFFTLIAWGGVSSIIVGAITGAWAGNLFDADPKSGGGFVSAGSIFARLRLALMVKALDPLDQPVRVLLVALAMGIANQFYGIILRMHREARRGNWVAMVCDGGLWLLFLPGLILVLAQGFATLPPMVARAGFILLAVGGVGLVLTQGRHEKGLVGKAVTGLVSLYGILGTYGATSFVGDTLSYSRLLALGLTTSIVGMCFNIIAGLAKGVPIAGIVLVMVVLLIGHVFNILISILGAFVHSARLIFVEFFGRFYEVGGKRFLALGTSSRVRVVDEPATVRAEPSAVSADG